MERYIHITENGIYAVLKVSATGEVFFLHCRKREFEEEKIRENGSFLKGWRMREMKGEGM